MDMTIVELCSQIRDEIQTAEACLAEARKNLDLVAGMLGYTPVKVETRPYNNESYNGEISVYDSSGQKVPSLSDLTG
jgi:hypothetical protein